MANIQTITPIRPILTTAASQVTGYAGAEQSDESMFAQVFQSMIENVKQTDATRNEKILRFGYRPAGQSGGGIYCCVPGFDCYAAAGSDAGPGAGCIQ